MELGAVSRRTGIAVMLVDLSIVCVSIASALAIQFGLDIPDRVVWVVLRVTPVVLVTAGIVYWIFGLHRSYTRPLTESLALIAMASLVLTVLTMAFAYGTRYHSYPRRVVVTSGAIQVVVLAVSRAAFCWRRRNGTCKRVLLVSDGSVDDQVAAEFALNYAGANACELVAVCSSSQLLDVSGLTGPVDALCIGQSVPRDSVERLVEWAQRTGKDVYLVPKFVDILLSRSSTGQIGDVPLFRLERLGLSPTEAAIKRLMDLIFATIGLVLTLPLYPLIAAAILIDSGWPVFYLQERVGQGGRLFEVLKFRTMVRDAERDTGPVLATAGDHRTTRVGRLLRACRLDELPQFINILSGDMSFVGPRPERPMFVEAFRQEIPLYAYRHVVKPGLTGLAQVSANYSTPVRNKLRYDLMYISHYSLLLDLQILAQTVAVLVTPRRAQGVGREGDVSEEWLGDLRSAWGRLAPARDRDLLDQDRISDRVV